MEATTNTTAWNNVAEIELVYKSKVKPCDRPHVTSSADVAKLLVSLWDENKIEFVEQFKVLLLNRANRVIGCVNISTGNAIGTIADPKLILVAALKSNCCGIIISHNHPSGNLQPSRADEMLTQKIKEAAKYLDIHLLDHVIVSTEGYYSFADKGLL